MPRPRPGVPLDISLPSGARVTITATVERPLPVDLPAAITRGLVRGDADLLSLPLADANVIEAIAAAMGAIETPKTPLTCRNCKAAIEVDAARALPLAPLLAPLGDPELDPPVDREEWHAFDAPVAVARRGNATRFRLARRTLRDRIDLEKRLDGPLDIAAPLVRTLGLVALGDSETEIAKSPIAIARALEALDDDAFSTAWDAICRAYDGQHWPPRLLAAVPCPECGARHDVEVVRRPLDWAPPRSNDETEAEFPSLEDFTARAATITREVLDDLGLDAPRGLEVLVEDSVPPCDDGGEPLLGSYTPSLGADGDVRAQSSPFVIALYFRTFQSMFEDEPYDVDAEIRETIEHELEHHIGFIEGHDPLDEEERAAIATEHRRLVGGTTATELAAGAGWLASDFVRFLRATWPLWAIVLFGLLVLFAGDR